MANGHPLGMNVDGVGGDDQAVTDVGPTWDAAGRLRIDGGAVHPIWLTQLLLVYVLCAHHTACRSRIMHNIHFFASRALGEQYCGPHNSHCMLLLPQGVVQFDEGVRRPGHECVTNNRYCLG